MKTPRIVNAVGHIDDELVSGAINYKRRSEKNSFIKWGALAACFAVLILAGAAILPSLLRGDVIDPVGQINRYKDIDIRTSEMAIEWPWEYKTVYEKYVSAEVDGEEFVSRGREVSDSYIDGKIGSYRTTGYDNILGGVHDETFEVYKIKGVSPAELVAVKMEERYYVFISEKYAPPATWGEVLDAYALSETVEFGRFALRGKDLEEKYYRLNDGGYIWEILKGCSDAEAADPLGWHETERSYISFTVTSEALGVYKRVLYVTDDGYLWTNIFDGEFLYYIGEEATGQIIEYAMENSAEDGFEPFQNTVVGEIVEITDEYIILDDSILCNNPEDGIVYRIKVNDLRISRYIDMGMISVGDTVQIVYEGDADGNVIGNAVSISEAVISGNDVLIPE